MNDIIDKKFYLGPIADPAPEFLKWWREELTEAQRHVIIEKELDQQINTVKFQIQNLNTELEKLQTMKTMVKTKGTASR